MADINIQRKKSSPSPWLLILLVLAVVGAAAWYLLRTEAAAPETAAPEPAETARPLPDSTTGAETGPRPADAVGDMAAPAAPVTPEVLSAFARTDATQPTYAREGLQLLTSALVDLANRDDLRDPAVSEKRDGLTSATARLTEPGISLRPGFVAAAGLMQAMQQKAYPALETPVAELVSRATQLSGRTATATDQQQLQDFFTRAAEVLRTLQEPVA